MADSRENKPEAMLLLGEDRKDVIYGEENTKNLEKYVSLSDCCRLKGDLNALRPFLASTEIICSGWGMMKMDEEFLRAAPNLKAVFYGAGSVRGFVTDAFWERGIVLTSAWAVNAVPVAEATIALMILALKKAFQCSRMLRKDREWKRAENIRGSYRASVGLIGMGAVGRQAARMLQNYDVRVFCYDPFMEEAKAGELGCTKIELDEMFATCDAVSLHAPNTPATKNMIGARHFQQMKDDAVFINTARGSIVNQAEMIAELEKGRIFACLDVTSPEPPEPDSPLYRLDNVFLTPHIAGSLGEECKRMGAYIVEEVSRFIEGKPPLHPVTEDMMEWMA